MRKLARASYVLRQLESVSHDFLKQQKCAISWLYRNGYLLIVTALPDSHVLLSFGRNLFNLVGLAFALHAGCLVWNVSSASANFESCSTEPRAAEERNMIKNGHRSYRVCFFLVSSFGAATLTIHHGPTN